ncbi:hypothetical protein GCM10009639_13390 [Kitasatospora putterlickiae]|uniref:Uncharacterized protein n=1 Tax=Kitasatospora putterlickiae TaxID=221725 RepID=A0ABN1XQS9_9ACTN
MHEFERPKTGARPQNQQGGTDVFESWDALYAELSAGADALGEAVGAQAGDLAMWDVPWSATETGGTL